MYKDSSLQIITIKVYNSVGYVHITAIYNSPSQQNQQTYCRDKLQYLFDTHPNIIQNAVITGDINQDISEEKVSILQDFLKTSNFNQHISVPTHNSGSILDHFYTKDLTLKDIKVVATYYSDHSSIFATLQKQ